MPSARLKPQEGPRGRGRLWGAVLVVFSMLMGSVRGDDDWDFSERLAKRRANHWGWRPVKHVEPPAVAATTWPAGGMDHFILARLEAAGLRPAPPADKQVLLRRASYAVTGLPPTPGEISAFLADTSPQAFARVVDRLLASPHFGERWARHWLDKVRYAETMGHEFDYPIVGAWRYRDYVVRAFNADLPYDRFVREQIAGDCLPEPRRNPVDGLNESWIGPLQYWLLQQVHSPVDVRNQQADTIDNQIDVVAKAFLGLTAACARCHDHKFDAISMRDYYALYGVLSGSRYTVRAVDDPSPRQEAAGRLRGWRDEFRRRLADGLLGPAATNLSAGVAVTVEKPQPRTGDRLLLDQPSYPEGEAFGADPGPGGQPVWNPAGPGSVRLVPPGWRHSASLSRRFQGVFRTATFRLDQRYLHLRMAGRGSRFNVVIEGFTLIRAPIYGALRQAVRNEQPHWVTVDLSMWQGRNAWIEFVDQAAPDPASDLSAETRDPEGWIAVGDARLSSEASAPKLEESGGLVLMPDPREVVLRWRKSPERLSALECAWLESKLSQTPFPQDLVRAGAELEKAITEPVYVASMTEGTPIDEPVFPRGNYKKAGEPVPRRFFEAMVPDLRESESSFREGTGRLALADAIASPGNPLVSRVMVNWVWSHLMGRGIVASVDNFGEIGDAPSHPELLDYLADGFCRGGWSVKRLIRDVLLSRAWQMSSAASDAEAEGKDPDNRLWHRANLHRLEGESIRDAMLAVSGRLDPRLGGPPVAMHLTPFLEGRGRPDRSGPVDGEGRRSLYLEVRRNFLSPFMLAFDTPVPATTVGRRSVSNVPAQSLAMMNDPFVIEQAALWARRVLAGPVVETGERFEGMCLAAFGRKPSSEELSGAMAFLRERTAEGGDEAGAWGDLAQALFNAKAFMFVE